MRLNEDSVFQEPIARVVYIRATDGQSITTAVVKFLPMPPIFNATKANFVSMSFKAALQKVGQFASE